MEKFKGFMEKFKKNIVLYIVVWLIIAILLVAPVSYTITQAKLQGITWLEAMPYIVDNIFKFPITVIFEDIYIGTFIECMKYYSLAYVTIMISAISKTLPKTKYDNIEHGSSDWCENGEQYRVLSKKSGIILAKEHYLPIDKTGNVNVLIVGRFWFW